MRFVRFAACALLMQPLVFAPALANSASLTVRVHVPLQCDVNIVGTLIIERRIVIDVQRSCNSRHAMIVSASREALLGPIVVFGNGTVKAMLGPEAVFFHEPIFASQNTQLLVECPEVDHATMERFARSISLRMEPT